MSNSFDNDFLSIQSSYADNQGEAQIISALVSDDFARNEIITKVKMEDFTDPDFRVIFHVVSELFLANEKINQSIVVEQLKNSDYEDVEEIIQKLISTMVVYPLVDNLSSLLTILVNKSTKLKLDKYAKEILETKVNYLDPEETFAQIQTDVMQIINSRTTDQIKPIGDYVNEFRQKLEMIKQTQGKLTGTTSGFPDLDRITNGFQPGDLIILAARPSIGKTALALNFLMNAAKKLDQSKNEVVVMFSLEMGKDQLMSRMICSSIPLSNEIYRQGNWDENTEFSIYAALDKIAKMNILVEDSSNITILDIQARLQQLAKTHKIKLVVIDYLQLIESTTKNTNRVQEVGKISRTLKILAKELQIPIIAIAQLSRKIEERKGDDRKPMLSDLRESGSIEQDADLVTFIDYQRDEIDKQSEQNNDNMKKYRSLVTVNFYIEKHRNGATGAIKLHFDKLTGRYIGLRHNNNDKQ